MNRQQEINHIRDEARSLTSSSERFLFDHPKFLSLSTSRTGSIIQRFKLCPRWHPKTPWLVFTHKDDATYKVMDPCTKTVYELLVPDLSGSLILASVDDWLFAQDHRCCNFFFINPFSKQRVDVPPLYRCLFVVAFSAPPTNQKCKVLYITEFLGRQSVQISIHHHGDDKWITLRI